jgi:hypothetical protein
VITLGGWLGVLMVFASIGHLYSPIVLMWMRADLRKRALERPGWHIFLPALAFVAAFMFPLEPTIGAYGIWNMYHYGMQHNGFWALTKWRGRTRDQRLSLRTTWVATTVVAMYTLPILQLPMNLFHWLGDISLSTWSARQRIIFLLVVMGLATTGLVMMSHDLRQAFPELIRARLGLGFIHFIVSALVWPIALARPLEHRESSISSISRWVWQRGRELLAVG